MTDHSTIGEIAAAYPASVRVFEKHRIDFCCGGKVPLEDACRARGIDPEELRAELAQVLDAPETAARDWNGATLRELIRHILTTHHDYLKSELPRLSALLEKVQQAHGENHGEMLTPLARVYGALREELEAHLMKEEMVLFPADREHGVGARARSFPLRVGEQSHSRHDARARCGGRRPGEHAPDHIRLHASRRRLQHVPRAYGSSSRNWSGTCTSTSTWRTTSFSRARRGLKRAPEAVLHLGRGAIAPRPGHAGPPGRFARRLQPAHYRPPGARTRGARRSRRGAVRAAARAAA